MSLFKKIWGRKKKKIAPIGTDWGLDDNQDEVLNHFVNSNADDRIRKVIAYGNSADLKYYYLLKYAIVYDPDQNVKFAALKRLHGFKTHPDCIPMITGLRQTQNTNLLEPYYSMALSKLGLISLDEFKNKMDGQ